MCAGARAVVELGAAPAERRDILVGDLLALDPLIEDADEAGVIVGPERNAGVGA